jgi:uncharacterized membrane protein
MVRVKMERERSIEKLFVCSSFIGWWLTTWLTFVCQISDKRVVVKAWISMSLNLGFGIQRKGIESGFFGFLDDEGFFRW